MILFLTGSQKTIKTGGAFPALSSGRRKLPAETAPVPADRRTLSMETTPQNTDQRENPAIPSPPALCAVLLKPGAERKNAYQQKNQAISSPPALCAVLSCREPRSGDPQCPFYCAAHLRMWRAGDKRGLLAALHGDLDVEVGG